MAALLSPRLSPRRTEPDLALRATVAQTERTRNRDIEIELPPANWLLAAVGGGLAASLTGWILVCGLVVLGWLASSPGTLSQAMGVGTQLWLLTNGASARLGSSSLTLVPSGATWLAALLLSRFVSFAGRHAARTARPTWRLWGSVSGVAVLAYAAPVLVTRLVLGTPGLSGSALVGSTSVIALGAALGGCRGLHYSPTATWPAWCRAVPRAVLGAQLVLVVAGAAALATGLLVHAHRVSALTTSLHPGWLGGIALWLAQVAWLPNAVVWAGSYVLGAGFSLGAGTTVGPVATQVGLLPSVPLLGALPHARAGDQTALWWLASGVLAGCVAGWLASRARPGARADLTGLLGGLSGALAGLVWTAVGWVSGGDLGTGALAGMGPHLLPLVVLSVSTLGLSGMVFGLLLGLGRLAARARSTRAGSSPSPDPSG